MTTTQRERLKTVKKDLEFILADLDEALVDAQVHYGHLTDDVKKSERGKTAHERVKNLDHANYFVKLAGQALGKILAN